MNQQSHNSSKQNRIIKKDYPLDGVFRKSSASGHENCVEVAKDAHVVKVRDTKDQQSSELTFTHDEWHAFLQGVRNGEFDLA